MTSNDPWSVVYSGNYEERKKVIAMEIKMQPDTFFRRIDNALEIAISAQDIFREEKRQNALREYGQLGYMILARRGLILGLGKALHELANVAARINFKPIGDDEL